MLKLLITASLRHRMVVLVAAGLVLLAGGLWLGQAPVDVLPDLTAPTVTVLTEAKGMAPEEIELLVTFPLESALNGGPGVRRVRSVSAAGISVIWVEFNWGADVYQARQIVAERLQQAELPERVDSPVLGPVSSIMGEIAFIALTADPDSVSSMDLRRIAETTVRRSLLAIPGISQVIPIGGDFREFQVTAVPEDLRRYGLSLTELIESLEEAAYSSAAGFHVDRGEEHLVRAMSRARTLEDLASAPVRGEGHTLVRVSDVATVDIGPEPKRGTASFNGTPAVVLSVLKQPIANTLKLTREIDTALEELEATLPPGMLIERESFRQASFIEVAVHNVSVALRDGAILVVLVLFLFLGNVRTTLISALAIPISLLVGVLVVSALGATINTMTLGGLTIAIGALVDDAIIVVDNVFRRLRENAARSSDQQQPRLDVIRAATFEVLSAIVFATLIIAVVFLPLFFLPGMEGRLLKPLGLAYLAAIAASLFVSLTVTPVLCLLLLGKKQSQAREPWLIRAVGRGYHRVLDAALAHPRWVLGVSLALLVAALAVVPNLGRSFLPPFNEGSLTVSAVSAPGIPLEDSDALGRQVEMALLEFPEVVSATRRTGRAEKDEHVQGVNASELEVVLRAGRPKEELLREMRERVGAVPGVTVSFGQPISHRIDHMISGSKSNLAVKIFGPDLATLRSLARQVEATLNTVPGIVDLSNQEQSSVSQLLVDYDRDALGRMGLSVAEASRTTEALFQGTQVGEILEDGVISRVVVRFPEELREHRDQLVDLPVVLHGGESVGLGDVADLRFDLGPSLIRRENVQRVSVLTANIAGSDLAGTVERARDAVAAAVTLPLGYRVVYGGQFEQGAAAVRNLSVLGVLIVVVMYWLLYLAFREHRVTLIVMINLPLALIGGIVAVALSDPVLNVATLIGFITLFGIATRNGVLLVSRYQDLMRSGVERLDAVRRGSAERLAPVLMTALTAGLALVPLILAGDEPGNEIQSPMGRVILGGLLTSTFLNLVVVPVLYARLGKR